MTSRPGASTRRRPAGSAPFAADERLAAGGILEDELIDERGIARHRIAEQVLPDTQAHADDLAGVRGEGRRLDPEVVGGERRQPRCSEHGRAPAAMLRRIVRSGVVIVVPHSKKKWNGPRSGGPFRFVVARYGIGMFGYRGHVDAAVSLEQTLVGRRQEREPSRKSLSLTSTPLARPAAGSPATIRLINTLFTLT